MTTLEIMKNAKEAKKAALTLSSEMKNEALRAMSEALLADVDLILLANRIDIENARGKISEVMIDRLTLTADRIRGMSDGMLAVASLPDPCGRILSEYITLFICKTFKKFNRINHCLCGHCNFITCII